MHICEIWGGPTLHKKKPHKEPTTQWVERKYTMLSTGKYKHQWAIEDFYLTVYKCPETEAERKRETKLLLGI